MWLYSSNKSDLYVFQDRSTSTTVPSTYVRRLARTVWSHGVCILIASGLVPNDHAGLHLENRQRQTDAQPSL